MKRSILKKELTLLFNGFLLPDARVEELIVDNMSLMINDHKIVLKSLQALFSLLV